MHERSRRLRPVVLSVLVVAAIATAVLTGCSKKTMAPDLSASSSTGTEFAKMQPSEFATLARVQESHTVELMKNVDVVGTGLGPNALGRAAILVLTRRPMAGLPEQIDGIAVEQRVVGDIVAYAKPGGGGGDLQCGTSTGNDNECASGTIGCVVLRSGTKYFLSNNHVFARENAASNGERIDAPGRYDGHPRCAQTGVCAHLSDFQTISFSGSNTIDAAIALPDPSRPFTVAEAGGYTPSSTTVAASVGLAVKKTGRTSGLTHGNVQAINVTIQVQYSNGGIATFTGQIMTPGSFIRSGDSGSLMVTETGNNPVGLCFAGGTGGSFANPIGAVLQRFNATVANQ